MSGRWMTTEPATSVATARFESIGVHLPATRVPTAALMASTRHRTGIELERLTGIHEHRVAAEGEDSYTLAVSAARDCLGRSQYDATELDMVIVTSISKYHDGMRQRLEPPLSLFVKEAIGATNATSFDLSNACAGMLTGVFVLNDFIRRGAIRRGARIGRATGTVRLGARVAARRWGYVDPLALIAAARPVGHAPLAPAPVRVPPRARPSPSAPRPLRLPWTAWAGLGLLGSLLGPWVISTSRRRSTTSTLRRIWAMRTR